jgi:hypothetical protein
MKRALTVVNAATATFECTFGRGCEGICCQHGEPSVSPAEKATIDGVLPRVRPLLRPVARTVLEQEGWLGDNVKVGQPMARVVDGWCIFFNQGCVLHQVGAEDGDFAQYKPVQCVLFPLEPNGDGTWYVRQRGYEEEQWDELFCLNPGNSTKKAVDTLAPEIAVAEKLGPDFRWPDSAAVTPSKIAPTP